jgi:hypothetical protein
MTKKRNNKISKIDKDVKISFKINDRPLRDLLVCSGYPKCERRENTPNCIHNDIHYSVSNNRNGCDGNTRECCYVNYNRVLCEKVSKEVMERLNKDLKIYKINKR